MRVVSKLAILFFLTLILGCTNMLSAQKSSSMYNEPHRPKIHFTPKKGWMNDPNGMVYDKGIYHLFFQHYPDSTVWGPMHWGHATSKDLIFWQEQPIALYPDPLGTIFSGSAVMDVNNTAGFGKNAMVAIFTHHDAEKEKTGSDKFQYQSLAYSNDGGKTWTKYKNNPVLQNPGIRDFRDPKVFWHEQGKKWVMTLATLDHITFYSSPNLKDWKEESKFGKEIGAHGGVWECPDLFPLTHNGKKVWVLIVNLNPGGPNGGSATQYFVGDFDGKTFHPYQTDTRWLDYGSDEYAGITWSNTGNRKIFLGWMSNWQYANIVPTQKWRSAMTIARDLGVEKMGDKYLVTSKPVKELYKFATNNKTLHNILVNNINLTQQLGKLNLPATISFKSDDIKNFTLKLSNNNDEYVSIGYDAGNKEYFIDRTKSGKTSFEKDFAKRHTAPRFTKSKAMDMILVIDEASVELFADNGLSVMTAIFFPNKSFSHIGIQSPDGFKIKQLMFSNIKKSNP